MRHWRVGFDHSKAKAQLIDVKSHFFGLSSYSTKCAPPQLQGGQTVNPISELIQSLHQGQPIILLDSESRENEGDLVIAAEKITPAWINFMIRQAGGLICLALSQDQVQRLQLPMMPHCKDQNADSYTAFTVSIDARQNIGSGISAQDRSTTILKAIEPHSSLNDFVYPGHIFPICGRKGGVLERQGHTESSLELVRLAGLRPGAVLCEILGPSGAVATRDQLKRFAATHGLKMGTVDDLIEYVRHDKTPQLPANSGEVLKTCGSDLALF